MKKENNGGLLFDLDGTLWDARQSVIDAWNETLIEFNIHKTFTVNDIEKYVGQVQIDIIKALLPELDNRERQDLSAKFSKRELAHIEKHGGKLYNGVKDILQQLSKNYNLYIVSNCQDGYIEAFLKFNNFTSYISDYECAGRTQLEKAANIQGVIERNNLKRCLYIGDTEGDQKAAKLNQLPFVFAAYGFGNVKEPDFEIKNPAGITDILNQF